MLSWETFESFEQAKAAAKRIAQSERVPASVTLATYAQALVIDICGVLPEGTENKPLWFVTWIKREENRQSRESAGMPNHTMPDLQDNMEFGDKIETDELRKDLHWRRDDPVYYKEIEAGFEHDFELDLLRDELSSDEDAAERSIEDGWYYED